MSANAAAKPTRSRRVRNSSTKKRQEEVEGCNNRRRSFALDVEEIPSFRRLNGDALFDEDGKTAEDKEVVMAASARPPRRRESRRTSHHRERTTTGGARSEQRQRRCKSTSGRTPRSSKPRSSHPLNSRRSSIQIQETKVVVQRLSSGDDVDLFKDESSKSLSTERTASISPHESLEMIFPEDPGFFGTSGSRNHRRSLDALEFDFDNKVFPEHDKNTSNGGDITFNPSATDLRKQVCVAAATAAAILDGMEDMFAVMQAQTPPALKPESCKPRPRTSDYTTCDDYKYEPRSEQNCGKPSNYHSRAILPRRRNSLGGESPRSRNSLGSHRMDEVEEDGTGKLLLPFSAAKSDYHPLHSPHQQNWSLPKLLLKGRAHQRRQRQAEEEQMCKQFFGSHQQ